MIRKPKAFNKYYLHGTIRKIRLNRKSNDKSKLRTFFNKIETTIHILRSVAIERSSYVSLLIPVPTCKLCLRTDRLYLHENFLVMSGD